MFKDYYQILEILYPSSTEEIKKAYRCMSLKWHPDKNPTKNVLEKMQDINEAYAILKDKDKKQRYDNEYIKFINTKSFNYHEEKYNTSTDSANNTHYKEWSYDYNVKDDILNDDIKAAREYAKKLVNEFIKNLKLNSKIAAKGAIENSFRYTIAWIIAGIILAIIGLLI